jgi:hypothetical protein
MKLVFDHRMFRHINEVAIRESGRASRAFVWLEKLLRLPVVYVPLAVLERLGGWRR